MFKLIRWTLKASLVVLVILVASHLVKWNGRTVSDQVRSTLSSAEKLPTLKTMTRKSKEWMSESPAAEILEQDKVELKALIDDDSKHRE